jgi:zinc protease
MSNSAIAASAPASLAPLPFSIPEIEEGRLSNGLRVVLMRNDSLPLVNIRLISHYGEVNDAPFRNGVIGAMAALLTEGAGALTSREIAERIENIGASLGVSSSADSLGISASCLSFHFEAVLRVFKDIVLNPTFPENELELFKVNTLEGLKYQRSQPPFLADERFSMEIYGTHPYSKVTAVPDIIASLSREELIEAHSALGVSNCTLLLVGDFEVEKLFSLLEETLGGLPQGRECSSEFPTPPQRNKRKLIVVDRKGSAQSNIVMGNAAIPRIHPDFFPALVMNQILGAGASSRLFMNLREEKGYTYGAYSKFGMRRFAGDFEASAEVRTEVTGPAVEEFLLEMNRIRQDEVSEVELRDARNYMTGVFPLRLETQEGLTNALRQQIVFGLHERYLHDYRDLVSDVTASDVLRVAQEWIHPDAFTVVVVGDAGDVIGQLSGVAEEMEVYDVEGNRVS